MERLASRIRAARLEAGLSRERLAGKVGCSLTTIVRYETGRNQGGSLSTLAKIATATGKPIAWFFEDDGVAV
jgi:transcriptional regulator with XRE-family HTH domain